MSNKKIRKKNPIIGGTILSLITTLIVWLIEIIVACMYYDVTRCNPLTPILVIPFAILWVIQGFVCYVYTRNTLVGGIMFAITGDIAVLFVLLQDLGISNIIETFQYEILTNDKAIIVVMTIATLLIVFCVMFGMLLFVISFVGSIIANAFLDKRKE